MIDPTLPDLTNAYKVDQHLPDDLAGVNPFATLRDWFDEAHAEQVTPNPNAMALATVDGDAGGGRPSCRVVLCRGIEIDKGYIVFFTNRQSRKGRALDATGVAAATFHWDDFDRQVRIEGRVVRSPDDESDAYFAGRGTAKTIAAWASEQSSPIASRKEMMKRIEATLHRFGIGENEANPPHVPRPPHWGGYRVWAESIELWVGNTSRMHDRAVWRRELGEACDGGFTPGAWEATRLQP